MERNTKIILSILIVSVALNVYLSIPHLKIVNPNKRYPLEWSVSKVFFGGYPEVRDGKEYYQIAIYVTNNQPFTVCNVTFVFEGETKTLSNWEPHLPQKTVVYYVFLLAEPFMNPDLTLTEAHNYFEANLKVYGLKFEWV